MCGLYSFRKSPDETRKLFNYAETPVFPPRSHVAPGGPIAVVRQADGQRHFALVLWGFIPGWVKVPEPGKRMINARAETVAEKPSFRNAFRRRRCLVPADGFYEWQGDVPGRKQPWFVHRPDHGLMAFAALWENWMGADGSEIETAAIITTKANAEVARIHPRSPVVIHPQDFEQWLDCENIGPDEAAELLKPAPDGFFALEPTVIARRPPPKPQTPDPPPDSGQEKLF